MHGFILLAVILIIVFIGAYLADESKSDDNDTSKNKTGNKAILWLFALLGIGG